MAFLLDRTSVLLCPHVGGVAQQVNFTPRVLLRGSPAVIVQGAPLPVSGCPLQSSGPVFCATGTFTAGTTRVLASGKALALSTSQANFVNTGATAAAKSHQTRVEAK